MQRTCDGTDPNLLRYEHKPEDCTDFPICRHTRPCDCGKTFDDVEYTVIYPHTYIPTREEKDRLLAAYEAAVASGSGPGVLRTDLSIGS